MAEMGRGLERERRGLHWLSHVPGWGAVKIRKLGEHMGGFDRIFNIEEKELRSLDFLRARDVESFLASLKMREQCARELESMAGRGIRFVIPQDEDYPERLKEIYDYPMGLYLRGRMPEETRRSVAIVGARGCTAYGRKMAGWLGRELAAAGILVISGLAAGVDGAGHQGALEGGGDTFGILGCGVNICYPRENYELFCQVSRQGGVISEFTPGEKPFPSNFPMRNRIISGLSDAVIVVEARERSGSLITVDLALEQGREVFAVPGRAGDELSVGCNQLIRQGAAMCTGPSDILEYFEIDNRKIRKGQKKTERDLPRGRKWCIVASICIQNMWRRLLPCAGFQWRSA